jgi:hypothetical protein
MNLELFQYWSHHIFVPAVEEHLRKIGRPEDTCVLLIIDNCKAHPPATELVSDRGNIFATFLLPNVTSLIQPMDQGVIENLKSIYRRGFMRKLVNYDGSLQQFISQYSIKDAVFNLACAWTAVKYITLRGAWRKLWPAVMFAEESSDGEKFKGFNISKGKGVIKETVDSLQDAAPSNPVAKLTAEEVDSWVNVDAELDVTQTHTDLEILDRVVNPKKYASHEEESDDKMQTKVAWAEAANAIELFMKFAEEQPSYSGQEVMQLHVIYNNFIRKRQKKKLETGRHSNSN